jgi:hypothetical protein
VTHTPGPWTVEGSPGTTFGLVGPDGFHILKIRGGMLPVTANARLITAAPTMLAALEAAQAFVDSVILWGQKQGRDVTAGMPGPYEVETKIAAAITAATGGARA